MANEINVDLKPDSEKLNDVLRKSFQSANINFMIGSGCSLPAINTLGDAENEIQEYLSSRQFYEAESTMANFLSPIVESSCKLMESDNNISETKTLKNYVKLLANISKILTRRKNNILPKQATIFDTNYDLFIEKASEGFGISLKLNDGFNRNPNLKNEFLFSSTEFFNSTHNNGFLYNYKVEIPSINLIKLHGSLSWTGLKGEINEEIIFSLNHLQNLRNEFAEIQKSIASQELTNDIYTKIKNYNDNFRVVLPRKDKFKDTLLNQIYYDLLRIYANELDKENTLLIAEGFSFADEHILDITRRSLKNPTLKLMVFCHSKAEASQFVAKFKQYDNVDIIFSGAKMLGFSEFNEILEEVLYVDELEKKDGVVSNA